MTIQFHELKPGTVVRYRQYKEDLRQVFMILHVEIKSDTNCISHVLYADGSTGMEYYGINSVFNLMIYTDILIDA